MSSGTKKLQLSFITLKFPVEQRFYTTRDFFFDFYYYIYRVRVISVTSFTYVCIKIYEHVFFFFEVS